MKKVLLTGASGFIGRHSIPFLLKKGYEVHAVDIVKKPAQIIANKKLFWHTCDLFNSAQQKKLIGEVKPTHLLHFAWYAVPGKYWTSLENLRWVQASLELLINFENQGGKRAVLAGTCAEYDWNCGCCSETISPLNPATLYGTCKHSLQEMLAHFSRQTRLSSAWGRVFHLYGPYEHPSRLVPSVICSLLKGEPVRCSHGAQIRDFLHVEDVASAFVALLGNDITGPVNIASGRPITLKDVICKIADKLGGHDLIQFGALPVQVNDPPILIADVVQLSQKVKWKPEYDIDMGLEQTIAWWKCLDGMGKIRI